MSIGTIAKSVVNSSVAKSAWSDLQFYAGDAAGAMLSNLTSRIRKNKQAGDVKYVYQRAYKNVFVFAAKRYAVQKLEQELKSILPKAVRKMESSMVTAVRTQQDANLVTLIEKQQCVAEEYGFIRTKEGDYIFAKDKYGKRVPEALMLSFDGESEVYYYDVDTTNTYYQSKYGYESVKIVKDSTQTPKTVRTVTRIHTDLSPEISMNSSKNIVLTQVTGRDYTRKELVSGGDLQFTINGSIVGDEIGVYPSDKVKAFMEIMEYGGIINVKSFFFGNLNISQIIIKDFSLSRQEYMNVQPYSFSCVAVEPDEEIKLVKDTIQEINSEIKLSPVSKWYKLLLDSKLKQLVTNTVVNATTNAVVSATSLGLDELTSFNDTDS